MATNFTYSSFVLYQLKTYLQWNGSLHPSDIEMDMHIYLFVEPLLASDSAAASAKLFCFICGILQKYPIIIHFQPLCAQNQTWCLRSLHLVFCIVALLGGWSYCSIVLTIPKNHIYWEHPHNWNSGYCIRSYSPTSSDLSRWRYCICFYSPIAFRSINCSPSPSFLSFFSCNSTNHIHTFQPLQPPLQSLA